jgi:hypothetical protein
MNKNYYKFDPVKLADETYGSSFSSKFFNSWTQVARVLARRGFNSYEAEAILVSKWTRWCRDEFHRGEHKASSSTLEKFLDKYGYTPGHKEVNKLVTAIHDDVVTDEYGRPCRATTNMMSGHKILVPLGTPLSCDPSSETYWSM